MGQDINIEGIDVTSTTQGTHKFGVDVTSTTQGTQIKFQPSGGQHEPGNQP